MTAVGPGRFEPSYNAPVEVRARVHGRAASSTRMAMISAVELRAALGADAALQARVLIQSTRPQARASSATRTNAPDAKSKTKRSILYGGLALSGDRAIAIRLPGRPLRDRPINVSRAFLLSGAQSLLLSSWRVPRAGRNGAAVMRWPWQRPAVEHRSSYTDASRDRDSAIRERGRCPSGAGDRRRSKAQSRCMRSALSACEVSGPSDWSRGRSQPTGGRLWRRRLIRHGQALYLIDADPVGGPGAHAESALALGPFTAGRSVASWFYRCELSGPSSTAWRTRSAGAVSPSPLAGRQYAAVGGCLATFARARYRQSRGLARQATLAEEASGPVGSVSACRAL